MQLEQLDTQVVLSTTDHQRLRAMMRAVQEERPAGEGRYAACLRALEQRLEQAAAVPAAEVPPDVVTMNARLVAVEVDTGREQVLTLVYDGDADVFSRRLSVLTPLGVALLGARAGEVVNWQSRRGTRQMRIERILYQPEAAGELWM